VRSRPLTQRLVPWAGVVVGGTAALTLVARGVPNPFLEDDAYFYLQIAWNIGSGEGSTFDGLHVTSGYHLLWMAVLSPLAFLVRTVGLGKPGFLVAVCALSMAIAAVTAATAFRTVPERVLALLIFLVCGITMETTLLGSLLVVFWRLFLGEIRLSWPVVALAAALVPLSRIDYAWLVPAVALVGALNPDRDRVPRLPVGPVVAGTLAGVTLHLAVLRTLFGAWATVSSAFHADRVGRGPLYFALWNGSSTGNLLRFIVLTVLVVFALRMWRGPRRVSSLAALALAVSPLVGYAFLVHLRDWYFLVALLLALMTASRVGAGAPRLWRGVVAALTLLVGTAVGGYLWMNGGDMRRTARFVTEANRALTARDVVYGIDGTGFPGWWLNAHVVNGDGLVNSWAYLERLRANRLATYLEDTGATHVLLNTPVEAGTDIEFHGLVLTPTAMQAVASAGETDNALVRYQLLRLRP
jgi:hypothetical protein